MKNKGQTTVPIILFMLLTLACGGLSVNSFTKIAEMKETLEKDEADLFKNKLDIAKIEQRIRKVIHCTGFYNTLENNRPSYDIESVVDEIAVRVAVLFFSKNTSLKNKDYVAEQTFSIDAQDSILSGLEMCSISPDLRQQMEEKGCVISSDANIRFQSAENDMWIVGGRSQQSIYCIEKQNNTLEIYLFLEKNKLTNNEYIKKITGLQEIWKAAENKILYEKREGEDKEGLQNQLTTKAKLLQEKIDKYQEEKNTTKKELDALSQKIQKAYEDLYKEKTEDFEGGLVQKEEEKIKLAKDKISQLQKQRLEAKMRVAKLRRENFSQDREQKEILDNLEERVRELQEAAAGEVGMDERIEEAIKDIDKALANLEEFQKRNQDTMEDTELEKAEPQDEKKKGTKKEQAIAQTEQRQKKLQEMPDGEIFHVDEKSKTVYIDIGFSQGVLKGLRFDVVRYGKGGKQTNKGKIIVRKADNNMSMAGILSLEDPYDPIMPGDKIINLIYDKDKVRYFVIAGRLEKYSLQEVTLLVEKLGAKIEKEITAQTDSVVLGQGFKDHPVYKIAVDRGIEMILEPEFLRYIEK